MQKKQKYAKSVDFAIMDQKSINLAFVFLGFGANSQTGLLLQNFQETVGFVKPFFEKTKKKVRNLKPFYDFVNSDTSDSAT